MVNSIILMKAILFFFQNRLNGHYTASAASKSLQGSVTPQGVMFLPVFDGSIPHPSVPNTLLTTASGMLPPHLSNHLNLSNNGSPPRQLSPNVTSHIQNNNIGDNPPTVSLCHMLPHPLIDSFLVINNTIQLIY